MRAVCKHCLSDLIVINDGDWLMAEPCPGCVDDIVQDIKNDISLELDEAYVSVVYMEETCDEYEDDIRILRKRLDEKSDETLLKKIEMLENEIRDIKELYNDDNEIYMERVASND